jgi:hypothetical protein
MGARGSQRGLSGCPCSRAGGVTAMPTDQLMAKVLTELGWRRCTNTRSLPTAAAPVTSPQLLRSPQPRRPTSPSTSTNGEHGKVTEAVKLSRSQLAEHAARSHAGIHFKLRCHPANPRLRLNKPLLRARLVDEG